jgi:transposase-like protein
MKCPNCGCTKLVKWGHGVVAGYKVVPRYQCTNCKKPIVKPIID